MGSRSTTTFVTGYENDPKRQVVAVVFQSYSAPPDEWGKVLVHFLKGKTVVNGVRVPTPPGLANGMGCLAAQLVARFKDDVGGLYLESEAQEKLRDDLEYRYTVFGPWYTSGPLVLRVNDGQTGAELFNGPLYDYDAWVAEFKPE